MRVISIINLKGGVGKTTTAVNMAAILAGEHGKHCIVIDADPQANATQFFGLKGEECSTLSGILDGCGDCIDDYIYDTNVSGVKCVPADIDLIDCDIASVRSPEGGSVKALRNFCDVVREDNAYAESMGTGDAVDFVIIDCPPSFTAASVAAIYASDDVIIPVKIDAFAVSGLRQLLAQIGGVQSIQPGIRIAGVLITMRHNAPAVVQGEALLRGSRIPVFSTHIRRSDKVDESTFAARPLGDYSRNSAAGVDYRRFVNEYIEGVR